MRFKKTLLVNVYYQESGYGEKLNFPPIGLGYISEYLHKENIQHEIIDTGTGSGFEDVHDRIQYWKPDLVGFSLNSTCFPKSFTLIENVKKQFPDVKIVVGGPHVSTEGVKCLGDNIEIDYGVIKEGEIPLAYLCNGVSLENIPGLIWRTDSGEVIANNLQMFEIEDFPFPRYNSFDLSSYYTDSISIITSRGCPFLCTFCQQSSLLGKKWRGRTPQSVVDEIEYWYCQGYSSIHILDDNFAFDKERLIHISGLITQKEMKDLDISLVGGVRISYVNRETLLAIKRMGVRYISFGVESGSDKILKLIRKGCTVKQAEKAIKMAVDLGFSVRLFFIIGMPLETMEDVSKSFELALRFNVDEVRFFNLMPYEGTGIMDWINENDATLLYSYAEYMSDFKKFKQIPVFDSPGGMNIEEKAKALRMSKEIINTVEERRAEHSQRI